MSNGLRTRVAPAQQFPWRLPCAPCPATTLDLAGPVAGCHIFGSVRHFTGTRIATAGTARSASPRPLKAFGLPSVGYQTASAAVTECSLVGVGGTRQQHAGLRVVARATPTSISKTWASVSPDRLIRRAERQSSALRRRPLDLESRLKLESLRRRSRPRNPIHRQRGVSSMRAPISLNSWY
jgi:hypothetical protein